MIVTRISYSRYLRGLTLLVSDSDVDNSNVTLILKQWIQNKFCKTFSLGIDFGSKTTGCVFHIVDNWLVRLTCGLISLVNDNHVGNNLMESLVYIYFGSTAKN